MRGVLGGYLLVWTLYGVVAKGNQDLHPDMTELIAWSRDLALGFPKHPPFAAIVVRGWFAILPLRDWAYYLLGISTATAALWIAWQLFRRLLKSEKEAGGSFNHHVHSIFQFPRTEIQREYLADAVMGSHYVLVSAFV